MNMISMARVEQLTAALEQATDDKDWQQIANLNPGMTELLLSLAGQTSSAPQHVAMTRLKAAYQRAYQYCRQEQQQLQAEISRLRHAQEGGSAYAAMAITADQAWAQHEEIR
jgi:DNA-binding GntR family transcriptional regulator